MGGDKINVFVIDKIYCILLNLFGSTSLSRMMMNPIIETDGLKPVNMPSIFEHRNPKFPIFPSANQFVRISPAISSHFLNIAQLKIHIVSGQLLQRKRFQIPNTCFHPKNIQTCRTRTLMPGVFFSTATACSIYSLEILSSASKGGQTRPLPSLSHNYGHMPDPDCSDKCKKRFHAF